MTKPKADLWGLERIEKAQTEVNKQKSLRTHCKACAQGVIILKINKLTGTLGFTAVLGSGQKSIFWRVANDCGDWALVWGLCTGDSLP